MRPREDPLVRVVLVALGELVRATGRTMKCKLILDVDTGGDDAVAILLAGHHPDAELVASHRRDGDVPRDGHDVLAGAGRNRAEGVSVMIRCRKAIKSATAVIFTARIPRAR